MKIYIAGKITNNPTFIEDFKTLEDKLTKEGHKVLNPATLPHGLEQSEYLHICMSMIDVCEIVYFMSNWIDSKGAHMEKGYCKGKGKPYKILESEE